jgi:hypothetical protein
MGKNTILGLIAFCIPLQAYAADQTIFTTQKPAVTGARDGVEYELGMRFSSAKDGQIKAIRFYKSPGETGAHTGKIYSASGQILAQVSFSAETACVTGSGCWQQQALSAPLSIAAGTEYVVSVNTGNQYYVATNYGLDAPVVSGDLTTAVGGNGVYGPVGSKPGNSYQNSNYFRDVVFAASSAPVVISKFKLGDRVQAWRQVNVRGTPALNGTLLGTQPNGAMGKLIAGPTAANGYIWWRIDYDNGVDGFSGEDNFNLASASPPPPSPSPAPAPAPSPSPSPVSGPPLTFNDARFNNAISIPGPLSIPVGGSLTDRSIEEFSGDSTIFCGGSCNMTRVRVNSRECVRLTSGNMVITDSYLEATGQGDDHADGIQAYSPGSHGTLTLRNTSIVAHNTAATAGIFIADNWKADMVDLENVMFKGGPYGFRLHEDGYTAGHLRMKNVCFVGPFGFGMMIIDPLAIIDEWTNVNECVIQNGQLVITKPIPRP